MEATKVKVCLNFEGEWSRETRVSTCRLNNSATAGASFAGIHHCPSHLFIVPRDLPSTTHPLRLSSHKQTQIRNDTTSLIMATAQQDATSQQDWDIAQYEAALAHLEKLQEQVRSPICCSSPYVILMITQIYAIRNTMQAIAAPLRPRNYSSKQQAFADLRDAAVSSSTGLQALKEDWTSEETRELFSRSDESLKRDSDLRKAMTVPHAGWTSDD